MNTEIERKWLLKRLPDIQPNWRSEGHQSYLSVDPVIRVRRISWPDNNGVTVRRFLTVKGAGNLSRAEFEFPISEEDYVNITRHIIFPKMPIHKENYYYDLSGHCDPSILADLDEQLRIDVVDRGTATEFIYAEVEFKSVEDARTFEFPFPECEAMDVTDDPEWKMASYWKRTRTNRMTMAGPMDGLTETLNQLSNDWYRPEIDKAFRENDGIRRIGSCEPPRYTVRNLIADLLIHCDLDMPIDVPDASIRLPYVDLEYDSYGPPRFDKPFTTVSIRTGSSKITAGGIYDTVNTVIVGYNKLQGN